MHKKSILAIDQGTTSSRIIVFDDQFSIKNTIQKPVELFYPHNGWVEQNAATIWHDVKSMVIDAIKNDETIGAIGITNQRETILLWNKHTGVPIAPAIVWQDRRTHDACETLKAAGHELNITKKTGLRLDPYFSATKISWLLDNIPQARRDAEAGNIICGTIDTWLIWNLTSGARHVTDATNASRTLLFNINKNEWDDELLDLFKIPKQILPQVLNSADDFGQLSPEIFNAPIPIHGVAGDQQAALIGQTCFNKNEMKATYGTGCFALINTGTDIILSKHNLLTTIAYRLNNTNHYAIEGSIFIAGAAIQFLRDQLKFFETSGESEDIATSVPDSHHVYFVPALTGLGAPYWDSQARGAVFGLTRDTKIAHIVRAALEAQAYQTNDLIKTIEMDTKQAPKILRVDGGLVHNKFMCQYLADILNCTIDVPAITESTALGAAMLAALGAGYYKTLNDFTAIRQSAHVYQPNMDDNLRQSRITEWNNHVAQLLYKP